MTVTEQQLTSLTPYMTASDWDMSGNEGVYIHRGTVYMAGSIGAYDGGPLGSNTILSGLPSALCPAEDTSAPLVIDPTNSDNVYASIGPFVAATMHTDGSWTFDGGNPFVSGSETSLYTLMSWARWPLPGGALADTYSGVDLTPYLAVGWAASASPSFAVHDARLHLDGSVVVADAASVGTSLLTGLPEALLPVFLVAPGSSPNYTEVPLPTGDRCWIGNNLGGSTTFGLHFSGQLDSVDGTIPLVDGQVVSLAGAGWPLAAETVTTTAPAIAVGAATAGIVKLGQ